MRTYGLLTLTVIVCVLGTLVIAVDGKLVEPCDPKNGPFDVIKDVRVQGCTKEPCLMKKEHNYTMEVDFVPTVSSATLNVLAKGVVAGVEVPWPGMKTDACQYGKVACPIVAGKKYTYKIDVHINKLYPSIQLYSVWYVTGGVGNKVPISCFKVSLTLVDA